LYDEVQRYSRGDESFFYRGYAAVGHSHNTADDDIELTIRAVDSSSVPSSSQPKTDLLTVRCRYVIAADGANSYLRDSLGIKLIGQCIVRRYDAIHHV
jgi:2-polyprenyl-6-methoxyphenol hydroxylase-like FAD-dependent oxidoreductase